MKGKIATRVARSKSASRSPFPRAADRSKHKDKQGFFNTTAAYRKTHKS